MEELRRANLYELLKMIGNLIWIMLLTLFTGFAHGLGPDDFISGSRKPFEYGPRPPLSVFDPSGTLPPGKVEEISDQLAEIYKNEGSDVIVVILADVGKAPPEHVARTFAKEWCKSLIHCVVLHVPGREDSPWIVPEGDLMEYLNPQQVRIAVESGQRRAAAEPTDLEKVRAAATEATDMLRFWLANALERSRTQEIEASKTKAAEEAGWRNRKTGALIAASGAVLFIAGGIMWVVYLRRNSPRYFGLPTLQRRLGAPHAGGNHAAVDLGSPPS